MLVQQFVVELLPRATFVIYDDGSEFKLHFKVLCNRYGLVRKPTLIKNPHANGILECIHTVISDMMHTSKLDMQETVTMKDEADFTTSAAWAICCIYHMMLSSMPGQAIFGRDIHFIIPYLADWKEMREHRQMVVDQNNVCKNKNQTDFEYSIGQLRPPH